MLGTLVLWFSSDNWTYCKSLWIKASAKCKCNPLVPHHLTCWLSGGSDCCSRVLPRTSSWSRGLGEAAGASAPGGCAVRQGRVTEGSSRALWGAGAAASAPSHDYGDTAHSQYTTTFTFSRRFYPKRLTISTFVRRKRSNNISLWVR